MGSIRRWCQQRQSHFGNHTLLIVFVSYFSCARLGIKNGKLEKKWGRGPHAAIFFGFVHGNVFFLLVWYVRRDKRFWVIDYGRL